MNSAPVSIVFWLHASMAASLAMVFGDGPLEVNELFWGDAEMRKEIRGPCQFFQSSYHSFHRDLNF